MFGGSTECLLRLSSPVPLPAAAEEALTLIAAAAAEEDAAAAAEVLLLASLLDRPRPNCLTKSAREDDNPTAEEEDAEDAEDAEEEDEEQEEDAKAPQSAAETPLSPPSA